MFLLRLYLIAQLFYHILHLHSNMFLLRLVNPSARASPVTVFTFQYVSIKTQAHSVILVCKFPDLHSNMFLLRQHLQTTTDSSKGHLHSNMFLLRRHWRKCCRSWKSNLHSNMFLLRLHFLRFLLFGYFLFTFQYVSIKTGGRMKALTYLCTNLHSNMFLLRPAICLSRVLKFWIYIPICFY